MNTTHRFSTCLSGLMALAWAPGTVRGQEVDFNREIRPILSENCFACHGPDEHERKAGLRMDERASVVELRDGARVIDLERPEASLLLQRIESEDPDEIMPPPSSHKKLHSSEIERLKRWIAQGAPYEEHWAFVAPERPPIPAVETKAWAQHPIDRFIQARLEDEAVEPSGRAERRTWLRRVTFDLAGVPPSPEVVGAFEEDPHPNAAERAVDRLLASPRYGERMAVSWMDAARYGDSSVMHADGHRDMWPWRDWLISAYNENKPFDDFTVEQLAGDLLPHPTVAQKVASGFNRNHATSDEGGAIPEELRVEYVVDRVKTTANVWLAMSLECGQCHDHKYDPISQEEYYQFFAYFNRTTDPGMQTRNGNQAPVARIFTDAQEHQLRGVRAKLSAIKERREEERPPEEAWQGWARRVAEGGLRPLPQWEEWDRLGPFSAQDAKQGFDKNHGPEKEATKRGGKGYGGKRWEDGASEWSEAGSHSLEVAPHHAVYLGREIEADRATQGKLVLGTESPVKVWLNGKQVHARREVRPTTGQPHAIEVDLKPGSHWLLVKLVGDEDGSVEFSFEWKSEAYPEAIRSVAAKAPASRSESDCEALATFYSEHEWEMGLDWDQQIVEATETEKAIVSAAPTSMIMEDQRENSRPTFVLNRGQYDQPLKDRPVEPGVPEVFPGFPQGVPNNRLGLAKWLTMPDHPLTARVAVNRYWAMLFGEGLVRTVGDFGNQGEWPSHPGLLDWLATDFVESGWNVKRALRQMVLSATYGQSSRWTETLKQKDPENRLLARASRFRLQAEFIRDQALAVSGLLVDSVGGPSVKPYQPLNIWNEVSLNGGLRYQRDAGERLYRRSLYTYWKRSAPMPNMMIFDSPSREKCSLQRPRTNTPLQALVTLNDPQFVEAARVLAQRLLRQFGSAEERLDGAFQRVLGRSPSPGERRNLRHWLEHEVNPHFAEGENAQALIEVGEFSVPSDLKMSELAAWTLVAQLLLNLDETLTRN